MAAVDQVTNTLASATISDPQAATEATAAQNDAVLAIVSEGRRLYIGNLAYATTKEQLSEFFKGYAVEASSIPTNPHTGRPVGYAFVDLTTADEAQRAISELSGQEILSRKVSVQLARKPEAPGEKGAGTGADGQSGGEGRRRISSRGRGRGRGRAGRGGRGGRANGVGETGVLPLTDTTSDVVNAGNGAGLDADGKPQGRQPRPRGPPEDGIPSKIKIMVANLPYNYTDEKLKDLFISYKPTAAKIALRPIPRFMVKKLEARGEPRKGRGFGFVSLESEQLQQQAVNEMNGKEIEGREIAVKVAIDSPGKEDLDPSAAASNGVDAANTVPAATA